MILIISICICQVATKEELINQYLQRGIFFTHLQEENQCSNREAKHRRHRHNQDLKVRKA